MGGVKMATKRIFVVMELFTISTVTEIHKPVCVIKLNETKYTFTLSTTKTGEI